MVWIDSKILFFGVHLIYYSTHYVKDNNVPNSVTRKALYSL